MADLSTCTVRTAPSEAQHAVRKLELDVMNAGQALSKTLAVNDEVGIVLDYSSLGLTQIPSKVRIDGPVTKTASGQANLHASLIEGSPTLTQATCELTGPCDVSGRKIQFSVIL